MLSNANRDPFLLQWLWSLRNKFRHSFAFFAGMARDFLDAPGKLPAQAFECKVRSFLTAESEVLNELQAVLIGDHLWAIPSRYSSLFLQWRQINRKLYCLQSESHGVLPLVFGQDQRWPAFDSKLTHWCVLYARQCSDNSWKGLAVFSLIQMSSSNQVTALVNILSLNLFFLLIKLREIRHL